MKICMMKTLLMNSKHFVFHRYCLFDGTIWKGKQQRRKGKVIGNVIFIRQRGEERSRYPPMPYSLHHIVPKKLNGRHNQLMWNIPNTSLRPEACIQKQYARKRGSEKEVTEDWLDKVMQGGLNGKHRSVVVLTRRAQPRHSDRADLMVA